MKGDRSSSRGLGLLTVVEIDSVEISVGSIVVLVPFPSVDRLTIYRASISLS